MFLVGGQNLSKSAHTVTQAAQDQTMDPNVVRYLAESMTCSDF